MKAFAVRYESIIIREHDIGGPRVGAAIVVVVDVCENAGFGRVELGCSIFANGGCDGGRDR